MKKKNIAILASLILVVLFISGIVLIFVGPTVSLHIAAERIAIGIEGLDPAHYVGYMDRITFAFQLSGAVTALLGGAGLTALGFVLYKEY